MLEKSIRVPGIFLFFLLVLTGWSVHAENVGTWDTTLARGNTRTIDFTIDEGTWMSVDISPDGNWLVFDLLGHIYRIPASGGEAQSLTQDSGVSLNYHPRYSPDGKEIAFVSDRGGQENLWIMNADGSEPRAVHLDLETRIVQPAWSPDSRFVLAVQRQQTLGGFYTSKDHLWKFPRQGGPGEEVLGFSDSNVQWPSMDADGKHIYFHRSILRTQPYPKPIGDFYQLGRLNLGSGKSEDVTENKFRYLSAVGRPAQPTKMGEMAPEISPDGRYMAFARRFSDAAIAYRGHEYAVRTGLWLRDIRTGKDRLVMDPITSDASDLHNISKRRVLPGYSWSSDSKSIVISQGGKIRRLWIESERVDTIPFTARVFRTISEMVQAKGKLKDSFEVRAARWPVSSPDGTQLVFEAVGKLWTKKLPDGEPSPLVSDPGDSFQMTPSWSADGRWITYVSWNDQNAGHVWKVSSHGGKPVRISLEAGRYVFPSWGPDGKSIIVNHWPNVLTWVPTQPSWEILQFKSNKRNAGSQIREPGTLMRQGFGYRGLVYYTEERNADGAQDQQLDPNTVLVGMDSDSGELTAALTVSARPKDIVLSHDGKWAAFQYKRDIYLAPMPLASDRLVGDATGAKRLSRKGGYFPHWRNATTLEYVSADTYYTYDTQSESLIGIPLGLNIKRPVPSGELAFTNARIVTLGTPKVIERGTLVTRGNRISCVGQCDISTVAKVIDAREKTIIPGWVDVHSHHNNVQAPAGIIDQHRSAAARYLAYGVTTTNDPGVYDPETAFAISELTAAGRILGPRTFLSGEFIICQNHRDDIRKIYSLDDAEDHVMRNANRGALLLKSYQQCNRAQRQMLVEAARETGIGVTPESQGINFVVGHIMDGHPGWEHFVQHFPTYRDFTTFAGLAGMHYSAQLYVTAYPHNSGREYWGSQTNVWNEPKIRRFGLWQRNVARRTFIQKPLREFPIPILAEAAADLTRAGGYYVTGAHSEVPGLDMHWEVWSYGMATTPLEALEGASLNGAHFLGLDQEIGSLEPGKLADLVVLDANPLVDLRNSEKIRYIMKGGRLYDANTLSELWPDKTPYGHRPWALDEMYRNDVRGDDYWDQRTNNGN